MTKKKKKGLGFFRIFVIILLLVLIALVLVLIFKNGINLDKEVKEEVFEQDSTNQPENLNDVVRISCNKYDVYFDDDNKLGFNFIIAELDFTNANGSLYYDLSNLTSSEKIKLNSVEYYLSKIKEYNYDIKKFDLLDVQFSSEGGNLRGNVFVPFLENYNEICIYNGEVIKFDLTKNRHSINELFYDVQTEDIKTDKYDITVSNSYLENEFVTVTGEQFMCPLALVFELTVNELSNSNVYIENAKFIPDGALSGFEINILPNDVNTLKIQNIINKKLKVGDKYGLFFQVSEQTNTNGIIMIKFSDSDKWLELSTGE